MTLRYKNSSARESFLLGILATLVGAVVFFKFFASSLNPDLHQLEMRREYAVGWFTLALLNTGIAQSKGKSGSIWFMISLLIGPVATLLLVSVRDRGELSGREREAILKEARDFLNSPEYLEMKKEKVVDKVAPLPRPVG